jgi:hypothetical protein
MTSPNNAIMSICLLIWKALIKTFHMRYYTILYRMVPSMSKFDLGVSKFRPAARPMKVTADRPQILTSSVAAHMLLSHQVWSWSDKATKKITVSLTTYLYFYHNMTFTFDIDLKWCHKWSSSHLVTTIQEMLYRCEAYWTRKRWAKMIKYKKKKKNTE